MVARDFFLFSPQAARWALYYSVLLLSLVWIRPAQAEELGSPPEHVAAEPLQKMTGPLENNLVTTPSSSPTTTETEIQLVDPPVTLVPSSSSEPVTNIAASMPTPCFPDDPCKWQVDITPYAWLPSSNGTTTIRGVTRESDVSVWELLKHFKFGAFARTEAWKHNWGYILDVSYGDLGANQLGPRGMVNFNLDFKQLIVDTAISRRFSIATSERTGRHAYLEPIAGVRNTYLKSGLELTPGPDLSKETYWMDLFVGGRLTIPAGQKWTWGLRGDIGGFGIGSSSHITWNLLGGFDYRPSEHWSYKVGYKLNYLNYSQGSGLTASGFRTFYYGPWLGITYHF